MACKNMITYFTVSELESYARCPKEYYLKYILGVPAQGIKKTGRLPVSVYGDIIHRMIEREDTTRDLQGRELFSNVCFEMEVGPIGEAEKRDILQKFELYQKSKYWKKGTGHEVPFLMRLGDNHIKGTLDLLIDYGDKWEVVDFKTGYTDTPEEASQKYGLQIRTYALATAMATGRKNGTVTLLFLSRDRITPYTTAITDKILKDTVNELADIMAKISLPDDNYRPGANPPCDSCPYGRNSICQQEEKE